MLPPDKALRHFLYWLPLLAAAVIALLGLVEDRTAVAGHDQPAGDKLARSRSLTVATPGISLASLVLALAGPDALVAATPEVKSNPWLRRVMPATANLPTPFARSGSVDRERLLAVKPDVVLLWGDPATPPHDPGVPNIVIRQMSYADPEHMATSVRELGAFLGGEAEQRAGQWAAELQRNRQRVAAVLAAHPELHRPRVYYASINLLRTEGGKSMVDAWISGAGGVNVAAAAGIEGDGSVHLEDVLAWNPEIIVVQKRELATEILGDSRWRDVSAVRSGRVWVNPGGINAWCTRAAEASLQVLWAAKVFHPEHFRDIDLKGETRAFYHQFYAYELSDDELARVLRGDGPEEPESKTNGERS